MPNAPEATPTWLDETAASMASCAHVEKIGMPSPRRRKMGRNALAYVLCGVMRKANVTNASPRMAAPTAAMVATCLPARCPNIPENGVKTAINPTAGRKASPPCNGDNPHVFCRHKLVYGWEPNSAAEKSKKLTP